MTANGETRPDDEALVMVTAVTVLGLVVTHPVTDEQAPALGFAFAMPDGTVLPTVVLVADDVALLSLTDRVRDAVRTARRNANR